VAHGGHEIEWLAPDGDAGQEQTPFAGFESDYGLVGRWLRSRSTQQRRFLGGLLALGLAVLVTTVTVRGRSADAPPPPPTWLANRPVNAKLSPFMAAECYHRVCDVSPASKHDLKTMRRLLDPRIITVGGERVSDAHGQLRGADVWVTDLLGDRVSINAVRVSQAPRGWDLETASFEDGSTMSRWVLNATSGVWLVEADATQGCGAADEVPTMYDLGFNRVSAEQLNL